MNIIYFASVIVISMCNVFWVVVVVADLEEILQLALTKLQLSEDSVVE